MPKVGIPSRALNVMAERVGVGFWQVIACCIRDRDGSGYTPYRVCASLETENFVKAFSNDTFSLWPAPGRVGRSSAITGHSPDAVNPADAGFLNEYNRPEHVIRIVYANGRFML